MLLQLTQWGRGSGTQTVDSYCNGSSIYNPDLNPQTGASCPTHLLWSGSKVPCQKLELRPEEVACIC